MKRGRAKWDDLAPRLVSAGVLIVVGLLGIWAGGFWFHAMIALICGAMIWELVRMLAPGAPAIGTGVLAALALMVAAGLHALAVPLLAIIAGLVWLERGRGVFAGYGTMVLLAGFGLIVLRDGHGVAWVLWLIAVVVASDVAGYFAGRALGGPKFWPRISPKKTWSGTIAGWIGAALVGVVAMVAAPIGGGIIGISVLLAMAAQAGDIAESAIKRRAGVKDSSALIPGHGGMLDRFDAMLGASVLLLVVGWIADFPPVTP